jgi:hypothetical protein
MIVYKKPTREREEEREFLVREKKEREKKRVENWTYNSSLSFYTCSKEETKAQMNIAVF